MTDLAASLNKEIEKRKKEKEDLAVEENKREEAEEENDEREAFNFIKKFHNIRQYKIKVHYLI